MRFFSYVQILFFLLLVFTINAQSKTIIKIKTIGIEQNLSSLNVRKIIEDKNNFLWFSTQDGLNKYEGSNIIQFTKASIETKKKLIGIDCASMEYNPGENYIYVLASYDGLSIIDINTNEVEAIISTESIMGNKQPTYFTKMCRFNEYLVITTNDGRVILFNVHSRKAENVSQNMHPLNLAIKDVFLYKNLIGFVISNLEIQFYSFKNIKFQREKFLKNDTLNIDRSSTAVINNNLWVATDKGIKIIDATDGTPVDISIKYPTFPTSLLGFYTTAVYFANNEIYISNINGTYCFNLITGVFQLLISINSETDNNFLKSDNSILYTKNELWIGGPSGAAEIKKKEQDFSLYYKGNENNKTKLEHGYGIKLNKENEVFIGCDDGMYTISLNKNQITKLVGNESFFTLEKLDENFFLMSGSKNLWVYYKGKVKKVAILFPELKPIQNEVFISIIKLNPHTVLLASQLQTGLYLWNMQKHSLQKFDKNTALPINDLQINNLSVEPDGTTFVTSESTIEKINFVDNTSNTIFTKQKLGKDDAGVFMDMCKQGNNYYLAGYGIGIIKLNEKFEVQKIISTKEGINNIGLFKIFSANDSLIVATSNNGLVIYNVKQDKVRMYYEEDGLHSNSFEEASGYQQGDSIYIGGLKGFTIFDTKKYKENNQPPKLYFNTISWETPKGQSDTTNLFIKQLDIPNNVTQTKISFTGLNYINPKRVKYWYRIKEIGSEWVALNTQNFVNLIGIPPGHYTLEVKAANEDGVECKPISMQLHFLPKWYQTILFKIVVGLLVALILFILYQFRIRQLKKIYTVRQKISGDLHDDIGSTLSSINMYSQIAQLGDGNNMQYINTIQENAREVQEKLDDIVWATNPKNDKIKNLVERIDGFARPLLQAKNIQFTISDTYTIANHPINEAARQCLFLICKEAINNSVKYAQCKSCSISIYIKQKNIHCQIKDDGMGFDTNKTTERNGLLNMQLRAKSLKGKFEITSEINVGTTISVVLPV